MNQSSIITAALLAGFVLYLAARDRLKVYAAVLWGPTAQQPPALSPTIPGFAAPGGGSSPGPGGLFDALPGVGGGVGNLLQYAPEATLLLAP